VGTDPSATVTAGGTATTSPASLTLPAMVIRLYTGTPSTPGSEEALPTGGNLVVTDTGCGVSYMGYTTTPPVLASGQAALPLSLTPQTNGGSNDVGLLTYPGMPDGSYNVCFDNGSTHFGPLTVTNQGSGEIVNLYAGSATISGRC
jgi:hypothetical protein